jgi:hypothetical protein
MLKSHNFASGQISLPNNVTNFHKCYVPKTFTEIQNLMGNFQGSSLSVLEFSNMLYVPENLCLSLVPLARPCICTLILYNNCC